MLLFISCGGGPIEIVTETATETAIETCAESYSEETSQLSKKNERTYFDDVFELVDGGRGYLFLSKDMTWYELYGGSMLFASYGTYTIKNGIVTLTEEYSDAGENNVYKYNIKYKGSNLFLSDTDAWAEKEYKISNVEDKEKIFGDVIELRRKDKEGPQVNRIITVLDGEWFFPHNAGFRIVLKKDYSCVCDGTTGTYTINNGTIKLSLNDGSSHIGLIKDDRYNIYLDFLSDYDGDGVVLGWFVKNKEQV